jgi:hypothetical protein
MARRPSSATGRARPDRNIPPYPPSWIDRLTASIDRLRVSPGVFYVIVGVAYTALFLIAEAALGAYRDGFQPAHIFYAVLPAYTLAVIDYLDRQAVVAASRYFASRPEQEADAEALIYHLTTMPARPAFWVSVGTAAFISGILITVGSNQIASLGFSTSRAGIALGAIHFLVMSLLFGGIIFHTIHQLRTIRMLHAIHPPGDVYSAASSHAFSGLTAQTAVLITLVNYGWVAVDPQALTNPLSLAITFFQAGLALAIFAWPLWGAHQMLTAAKAQALTDNGIRFKAVTLEMHRRLDGNKIAGMDELSRALAGLDQERARILQVPTWPWNPGTLRGVVAALFTPIVIWLVQYFLGRALN